jgi:hypothetical protein
VDNRLHHSDLRITPIQFEVGWIHNDEIESAILSTREKGLLGPNRILVVQDEAFATDGKGEIVTVGSQVALALFHRFREIGEYGGIVLVQRCMHSPRTRLRQDTITNCGRQDANARPRVEDACG